MCDMALELPDEVPCCIENVFYEFRQKVVPPATKWLHFILASTFKTSEEEQVFIAEKAKGRFGWLASLHPKYIGTNLQI